MGFLMVGAGAAILAKFSGDQLAEVEPLPERHSDLGNLLCASSSD